jgi:hypothetical protein
MSNYLVWHQHGKVQPPVADESDRNDDEDRMDNMVVDIGRAYGLHIHYGRYKISTGSVQCTRGDGRR